MRRLLRRVGGAGLAVACFVSVLGGCGGGSSTPATTARANPHGHPEFEHAGAPAARKAPGVKGILQYGVAGSGAQGRAVEGAARSYFAAFAAREYLKVCNGLSAANREDLQGTNGFLAPFRHGVRHGSKGPDRSLSDCRGRPQSGQRRH